MRNENPPVKGSAVPAARNDKVASIVSEGDRFRRLISIYICPFADGNE